MSGGIDRRTFLAAAAAGCTTVPFGRDLLPYVDPPPEWAPGIPTFYATSLVDDALATGVLVECHDGRPTKVEGNPRHPASLGATSAVHQAAILDLYDAKRLTQLNERGVPRDVEALRRALHEVPSGGAGVHLVLEPTTSTALRAAIDQVRTQLPQIRVHTLPRPDGPTDGALLAVGAPLVRQVDLSVADVVVAFDTGPVGVRQARDLADARRRNRDQRVWVAESGSSAFGATADERLALRPSEIPAALVALAAEFLGTPLHPAPEAVFRFVRRAAADLRARPGVVLLGPEWPGWMHALVVGIEAVSGALGKTSSFTPSPVEDLGADTLRTLLDALDDQTVHTLVVLSGDPARGPGDLGLERRLLQARRIVQVALRPDTTTVIADWVVPALHPFESWGDARSADGTRSPIQPMIRPLFAGLQPVQVLGLFGDTPVDPRQSARQAMVPNGTDDDWRQILRAGLAEGSAFPPSAVGVALDTIRAAIPEPGSSVETLEIGFVRGTPGAAHNAWLQELPDVVTQVAWGNVARLGPVTARAHRVSTGDRVRLSTRTGTVELPAMVIPIHPEDVVTVDTGYGAGGIGVDVDPLRSSLRPWHDDEVRLEVVGHGDLVQVQHTLTREGTDVARVYTVPELADVRPEPEAPLLWPPIPERGVQWGMAIDLDVCTGCNACAVACQAENNVPVVGPIDTAKGRRMHWLRIDRYFDPNGATFQPMLCQHCAQAPCEYVCPVYASVHSSDGLNEQVYNRCIGTRVCSQNCPYKVRRFNWFDYSGRRDELQVLQLNPDVTVRDRGVMEKCTFCVQRIREGERIARLADRDVTDADVVPACAQACPSRAITFGRVDVPGPVPTLQADPRAYGELDADLATRPRVRYLARIRNLDDDESGP